MYGDGGRAAAGYKGNAGDCVCRAIAIASGLPYQEVYSRLARESGTARVRHSKRRESPRNGIMVQRPWFKRLMTELGFTWTPTMGVGTGCKVHLRPEELPAGRLVVAVSRHMVAVIDGVIHDTHDSTRGGTRCVYGYWRRT